MILLLDIAIFASVRLVVLNSSVMVKIKDGFQGSRIIVLPQSIIKQLENDPLTSALYVTDIGFFPKANNHHRERKVPIDQYVLIYCVNGCGWYQIDNMRKEVCSNQFFILPAGKPHSYGAKENTPWTIYWIHFKGNLAPYYSLHALQPIEVQPAKNSRIQDRLEIFEEIYRTLDSNYSKENLRYASSLLHYFLGSLMNMRQFHKIGNESDYEESKIQVSIHYMKENIEKKLTVEDFAQNTGYSVSHYSAVFRQLTGHTPLAYFNLLKIRQACFLLDTTNMKMRQICFKIGIEDAYYFSRLFSKLMGMSPKSYREREKG